MGYESTLKHSYVKLKLIQQTDILFKALDFYNNQVFVVKQIFLFNDINGDIEENFTVKLY